MRFTVLFVSYHGAEIDILHTAEDVLLDLRIDLFQLSDKILDFQSL